MDFKKTTETVISIFVTHTSTRHGATIYMYIFDNQITSNYLLHYLHCKILD